MWHRWRIQRRCLFAFVISPQNVVILPAIKAVRSLQLSSIYTHSMLPRKQIFARLWTISDLPTMCRRTLHKNAPFHTTIQRRPFRWNRLQFCCQNPCWAAFVVSIDGVRDTNRSSSTSPVGFNYILHQSPSVNIRMSPEGFCRRVSGPIIHTHRLEIGGHHQQIPSVFRNLPNHSRTSCELRSSQRRSSCSRKREKCLLRKEFGVCGARDGNFRKVSQRYGFREKSTPRSRLTTLYWTYFSAIITRL